MIERLNFYDLYGYLLPGLAWLGLMWLPFGLVGQYWPRAEWSSALVALVLGYIAGHVLQGLAAKALPSVRKVNGESRHPSDILLDDANKTFSPEVKSRLALRIILRFDIDVGDSNNPDPEDRKRHRYDAFMLCRRTLIQKGVGSYAEQFEGMYAFMRGVTAACIFSFLYHLGWILTIFFHSSIRSFFYIAVLVLLVFVNYAAYKREITTAFWFIGALLLVLGTLFGSGRVLSLQMVILLAAMCLTSLLLSFRCYDAYQDFSDKFAETVYRDFCAL